MNIKLKTLHFIWQAVAYKQYLQSLWQPHETNPINQSTQKPRKGIKKQIQISWMEPGKNDEITTYQRVQANLWIKPL